MHREPVCIDLNADLGEGMPYDEAIMPYLSSCSIACGGHFGNESSMREAIRLAKKYNVKVGAHPSFPDMDNFGRKIMTMTKAALTESIFEQITLFFSLCASEEIEINHVKLHGALYNYAAKDTPTAVAVVEAIVATKMRPKLYVPPNSVLSEKAKNLLPLVYEAFIDRRYELDLSLVPRTQTNAVITSPENAWKQLKSMVFDCEVETIDGKIKTIEAETYCIHGDNPEALKILHFIHEQFRTYNISLK
jgi:UPF0271 protein